MTVEIKTRDYTPKRHTFGHIARRLGGDKPASRYQEATLDVQATDHFHYKPLYEPEFWHYDTAKTQIVMEDWYKALDPRQLYYATYNIARANMNQSVDRNFTFVEEKGLLENADEATKSAILNSLVPARHIHWGANMNMSEICHRGYGTAITAPCIFSAGDHLGMAQIVSRIGLEIDGQTGNGLEAGKTSWLNDAKWQGVRKLVEDTFVVRDWFELFTAQTLGINAVILDYIYNGQDALYGNSAIAVSMLTEFMADWAKDENKWTDAVIKTVAAESVANKTIISGWASKYIAASESALATLCGDAAAAKAQGDKARAKAKSLGLEV